MKNTDREFFPTDDRKLVDLAHQVDANERPGPIYEEMDADVVISREGDGSFMLPSIEDVDAALDSIIVDDEMVMEENDDFDADVPTIKRENYSIRDDYSIREDFVDLDEEATDPTIDTSRQYRN